MAVIEFTVGGVDIVIPDPGDRASWTRLYWTTVSRIRSSALPANDEQGLIADVDRVFKEAGSTTSPPWRRTRTRL